jgi:hypothetical protein
MQHCGTARRDFAIAIGMMWLPIVVLAARRRDGARAQRVPTRPSSISRTDASRSSAVERRARPSSLTISRFPTRSNNGMPSSINAVLTADCDNASARAPRGGAATRCNGNGDQQFSETDSKRIAESPRSLESNPICIVNSIRAGALHLGASRGRQAPLRIDVDPARVESCHLLRRRVRRHAR